MNLRNDKAVNTEHGTLSYVPRTSSTLTTRLPSHPCARVGPAKTDEPIEMPFVYWVGQKSAATVRLANTLLKDEESARDNHVRAGNFAKYSPI